MADSRTSTHHRAAETFARQARERYGDAIDAILLYGSVARGEERGEHSDVDLLIVLRDPADESAMEEAIRELAYGIELEHGVVLSLVVRSESEFERQKGRPFFRRVRRDAEILHG